MPGMDGEQLCKKIREQEREIPIWIIMLTIKGEKNDIIRGLQAGANDYLSKPYDAGELYARIDVGGKILGLECTLVDKIENLKINEKKIETLLAEKELLLYEVHHRIKNNMNTIINLLTIQADALERKESDSAVAAIRNAASRLKSTGILYDKLYRSESLTKMSVQKYLPDLIEEIISVFPDRYRVQTEIDIADVEIDVQQLSALGMILNELIVNSMKHAFLGRDTGLIEISVTRNGEELCVAFRDDGIGIPDSISFDNPDSFGLRLIKGIAGQIGSTVQLQRGAGTRFVFKFGINP
jgi:two-component sensor histidine kinase